MILAVLLCILSLCTDVTRMTMHMVWASLSGDFTSAGGRHARGHHIGESGLQIEEGRVIMDGKLMSTVVWSLAIFRAFESPLYDGILRSMKQCDIRDFDQESVRRLYQVNILGCGVTS